MKHKVLLSTYSVAISGLCIVVLLACLYYCRGNWGAYAIGATLAAWLLLGLFYMPMSVSIEGSDLCINRSLRIKSIPMSEIESARLLQPTMAERRLLGSGGFMGYWGWFSEPSIGKYFAYYGKASDCFLVQLKNGRKYLLGCENPAAIVDYINSKI